MTPWGGRKRGQREKKARLLNWSSFFSEPKKRSTGTLSGQLPFRLMLMFPHAASLLFYEVMDFFGAFTGFESGFGVMPPIALRASSASAPSGYWWRTRSNIRRAFVKSPSFE